MRETVMKRGFIEADLPLAQACLASVSADKNAQHLVKPFRAWVQELTEQLATYEPDQQ